jgi:DNA adenine methylase
MPPRGRGKLLDALQFGNSVETAKRLPPLFRWPGGKRWLAPGLLRLLPADLDTRYFEPFFGGGALFFALRPQSAILSDSNDELMACYRAIVKDARAVEGVLRGMPTTEAGYYEIRAKRPTDQNERAARLVFLTAHSFNGIFRVNRQGVFNVPFGRRIHLLGEPMSLEAHREALATATLLSGDFSDAVASAKAGDVVYLDPPYTVTHSKNGFLKYNARVFSWRDQERLAAKALELDERGCTVLISNADHRSIEGLYARFRAIPVSRSSRMASDPQRRRPVTEYVFTNAPAAEVGE